MCEKLKTMYENRFLTYLEWKLKWSQIPIYYFNSWLFNRLLSHVELKQLWPIANKTTRFSRHPRSMIGVGGNLSSTLWVCLRSRLSSPNIMTVVAFRWLHLLLCFGCAFIDSCGLFFSLDLFYFLLAFYINKLIMIDKKY